MNNMNKQQLFAFITEVSFALDDISLYLDTHPECPKALAVYNNYKAMRQQAEDGNPVQGLPSTPGKTR